MREKYEHEFAVAAALLEVQTQHDVQSRRIGRDGHDGAHDDEQLQQQHFNKNKNLNENPSRAIEQLESKIREQNQTIAILQQMFAQSQDDLRSLAHEYNEGTASLNERAEKAEAEMGKLRLVNVEQLEWIRVLEQRLAAATGGGGVGAGGVVIAGNTFNNICNNNNQRNSRTPSLVPSASPVAAKLFASPQQQFPTRGTGNSNSNGGGGIVVVANADHQQHFLRTKLTEFYSKYDPSRVPEVDAVLEQWRGKETELERLLETPPVQM